MGSSSSVVRAAGCRMVERKGEVTRLLEAWSQGDRDALDRLVPILYGELRRIARSQMAGERTGHTLRTTALLHEAFLELARLKRIRWQDRTHFLAMAARVMRRILVDHAVRQKAAKRGGGRRKVPLEEVNLANPSEGEDPDELLALDEALSRLESMSGRQARVVECRVFAGMDVEETAETVGVSTATVKRDWAAARAWLNRELAP